jgi:hypothetical protein
MPAFDTICCLLLFWFEKDIASTPNLPNNDIIPEPYFSDDRNFEFRAIEGKYTGKSLVDVLLAFPEAIPLDTNPSTIFFLASAQNFVEAYNDWLKVALILREVKVGSCFLYV